MIKLIVGLGNIGEQYKNTRHNVGFLLLDALAKKNNLTFQYHDFNGEYTIWTINETKIILLKPHTYMNLSGQSLIACMHFFKIHPSEIVVIYDDKDLLLGKYAYKMVGNDGGHNGIKNIIAHLYTNEFKRIKIGIGPKPPMMNLANFVLSHFKKNEQETLSTIINRICRELSYINNCEFSNLINLKK